MPNCPKKAQAWGAADEKDCAGLFPAWQPCSSQGWASGPRPGPQVSLALGVRAHPHSQASWKQAAAGQAGPRLGPQNVNRRGHLLPLPAREAGSPAGQEGLELGGGHPAARAPHPRPGFLPSTPTPGDKVAKVSPGLATDATKQQNRFQAAANLENSRDGRYPRGRGGRREGGPATGPPWESFNETAGGRPPGAAGSRTRGGFKNAAGLHGHGRGRGGPRRLRPGPSRGAGTGAHAHSAQPRSTGLGPRPPSVRNLRTECTGSGCWGQAGPA